jgi:plastocyanin
MKFAKHAVAIMITILLSSVTAFGQEMKKQETASAATTTIVTVPTATAHDAKPAAHEHAGMTMKKAVAVVGADGMQRIEVIGGEYYYDPNYIVVQVNRTVELKVKKAADSTIFVPHNIMVKAPEAGIDFNIDMSKETQTIKFIPTVVGKYPMYCDKKAPFSKSHREKGMEGMIEVVE